ncbi:hypothetical protein [Pseudomonas viridiflava]|uniref:hypothetical protein n=1 Tax=Pseudomonas viridiflava TaxID=33069 RepID=UPI000F063BE4|nr:hypothetical protein [Pseudomonas viridiflava]
MDSSNDILSHKSSELSGTTPDEQSTQDILPLPLVPAVIDINDPEGLLPTGTQNEDLEAFVEERWKVYAPDPSISDRLEWFWALSINRQNPTLVGSVELIGPVEDSIFPYPIPVPKNLLQSDGKHELWYVVTSSLISFPTPSNHKFVTIDTTAPSYDKQLESLLYPADLTGTVITADYLATHSDTVELSLPLPLYTGVSEGDSIFLYWSDVNPPLGLPVSTKTVLGPEIIAQDIRLDLKGDIIRSFNKNGIFHAFYKVRDRAGNETLTFSLPATATVSLDPLPVVLPAPTIPLHDNDGLLHRADARSAIKIEITYFDNALPTDEVVFNWDGITLTPRFAVFPVSVDVPWAVLTANGMGPRSFTVNYEVFRGGWSLPSNQKTINVDFSIAGQDHPAAPALLNTLLSLCEIRGQSNLPNELIPTDRNAPVIPSVELFQNPVAGQRLELYWGAWPTAAAFYTVQPGDVAGQPIQFSEVPWNIIDSEPNNAALPVYYTTSNAVNLQQSSTTYVKVRVVTIDDLLEPDFPDADLWGYINCGGAPWDGIKHKITFINNRFEARDVITLFWEGYRNFNATDPISGTYGEFEYELNTTDITNGFTLITVLPYSPYIEPITEGSGGAFYTLAKRDGQFGTSPLGIVKITRLLPDGTLCEPPF